MNAERQQQPTTTTTTDRRFASRVRNAIAAAQAWDDDPTLLAECRAMIPFEDLRDDDRDDDSNNNSAAAVFGPYSEPSKDRLLAGTNERFVQRLARYFKRDVMTWVNVPPCRICGEGNDDDGNNNMKPQPTRGPETPEEIEGNASRVELYRCSNPTCDGAVTAFPRYNSPRKLLETRRGRCGEYANLFGLYCRAAGLETRYVTDWTDHVWTEVRLVDTATTAADDYDDDDETGSNSRCNKWIMVDSCEGVLNEPSMYEKGWGKKMNCVVAAAVDHVVDVTARYTRRFGTAEFERRRRAVVSSESAARRILDEINRETLWNGLPPRVRADLERRLAEEQKLLDYYRDNATEWDGTNGYNRGRISGSLTWKLSRQEAGRMNGGNSSATENGNDDKNKADLQKQFPGSFRVESFFPTGDDALLRRHHTEGSDNYYPTVSITVRPYPKSRYDGIVVSGTPCSVGTADNDDAALSVAVVDEEYLGCVLQSRCFRSAAEFADFVDTVPTYRIVAVQGSLPPSGSEIDDSLKTRISKRLCGFNCDYLREGVLFLGQVRAEPDWAFCGSFKSTPRGYGVVQAAAANGTRPQKELRLATRRNTRPASIVGRLPETVMPLATQLLASHEQKRTAFLSYLKQIGYGAVSGYATKKNAPVYLLGSSAYPLECIQSDNDQDSWSTFLLLSPPLVDDDDVGIVESVTKMEISVPKFDVPLESTFFTASLGSELLVKQNGTATRTDTLAALHNALLVGFYFSAHWCGRKSRAKLFEYHVGA